MMGPMNCLEKLVNDYQKKLPNFQKNEVQKKGKSVPLQAPRA
jgi:hypothetical protein